MPNVKEIYTTTKEFTIEGEYGKPLKQLVKIAAKQHLTIVDFRIPTDEDCVLAKNTHDVRYGKYVFKDEPYLIVEMQNSLKALSARAIVYTATPKDIYNEDGLLFSIAFALQPGNHLGGYRIVDFRRPNHGEEYIGANGLRLRAGTTGGAQGPRFILERK
jgi:hypothetical protein